VEEPHSMFCGFVAKQQKVVRDFFLLSGFCYEFFNDSDFFTLLNISSFFTPNSLVCDFLLSR